MYNEALGHHSASRISVSHGMISAVSMIIQECMHLSCKSFQLMNDLSSIILTGFELFIPYHRQYLDSYYNYRYSSDRIV